MGPGGLTCVGSGSGRAETPPLTICWDSAIYREELHPARERMESRVIIIKVVRVIILRRIVAVIFPVERNVVAERGYALVDVIPQVSRDSTSTVTVDTTSEALQTTVNKYLMTGSGWAHCWADDS